MKGVPLARAPFSASRSAGRTSGSASSNGKRNVIASVDPGASAATWRGPFHAEILDEARTGTDGCSEGARGIWVHVRTPTPTFFGGRQPQANLVFEHVWGCI